MSRTNLTHDQLRRIKAIALDVDGVLTDGGMWWGLDGEEFKRFSFSDIMGISLAHRKGFIIALISGEASPLVDRYAAKMMIADVTKGCRDKGLSAAPSDARQAILEKVDFVAVSKGGNGAVRELVDALLAAHGTDAETVFRASVRRDVLDATEPAPSDERRTT